MALVTITEITDPFCTWCWGTEPILRRVNETYREQVEFEFVMGGLVEDFETFRDAANDISEPRDVAPHWEEASERHGMPVDSDIWRENPPQSSYPASIAYKAAEFQGEELAHSYLRRLREAVTVERRDISREAVLLELADEVGLDTSVFANDIESEAARERFEADRRFVRESQVTAFPTFRIEAGNQRTWVEGFHRFDAIQDALTQVAPGLEAYAPRSIPEFVNHYGRVATQEVAEVYDMSPGRTMQVLRSLEDEGVVSPIALGNGYLWTTDERTDHNSLRQEAISSENSQPMGHCTLGGECMLNGSNSSQE